MLHPSSFQVYKHQLQVCLLLLPYCSSSFSVRIGHPPRCSPTGTNPNCFFVFNVFFLILLSKIRFRIFVDVTLTFSSDFFIILDITFINRHHHAISAGENVSSSLPCQVPYKSTTSSPSSLNSIRHSSLTYCHGSLDLLLLSLILLFILRSMCDVVLHLQLSYPSPLVWHLPS